MAVVSLLGCLAVIQNSYFGDVIMNGVEKGSTGMRATLGVLPITGGLVKQYWVGKKNAF